MAHIHCVLRDLAPVQVDRAPTSVVTFSYREINLIAEGPSLIASFILTAPLKALSPHIILFRARSLIYLGEGR